MNGTVLKQFLISIGFYIDEKQIQQFNAFMDKVSSTFKILAVEGAAAVLALSAEITNLADEMENLYFVSQRTGASAGGIRAFQFGAKQVGVSAEQATQSLEAFAQVLRTQPGTGGILKAWGIDVDHQDKLKSFLQLIDILRRMPHFQAAQYGKLFGIDEVTLTMLTKNFDQLKSSMASQADQTKKSGVNMDDLTAKSHEFMVQLRALEERWKILALVILKDFLPTAEKVLSWLNRATDWIMNMDKATNGLSTRLLAVLGILTSIATVLGSLKVIGGVLGLGGGAGGVAGGVAAGGGLLVGGAAAAAGTYGIFELLKRREQIDKWMMKTFGFTGDVEHTAAPEGSNPLEGLLKRFEGHTKGGYGEYTDEAGVRTAGFGHKVKPGERFADDFSLVDATKLLAQDMATAGEEIMRTVKVSLTEGQKQALTSFDFNVGDKAFEGSSLLKDVNEGDFTAAQAEFSRWNKIHKNGQLVSSEALTARRAQEASLFGGGSSKPGVNINQKTDIHVNGSADPRSTADQVSRSQQQVNRDIVRNMQGVLQ